MALLLSDEFDRADDLVVDLAILDESAEERARFWLFMLLGWVLENRAELDLDRSELSSYYARSLIRAGDRGGSCVSGLHSRGRVAGVAALEQRWGAYVDVAGP